MTLPLIAIGLGNTSVKAGSTESDPSESLPIWKERREYPTHSFDPSDLGPLLTSASHRWLVASVQRKAERRLADWVRECRPDDEYCLLAHPDLPIAIDVLQPDRVGLDRLAAAVAANRLRDAGRPAVVIDAGTALTVNLVTADGVFRGGVILPGFKLITSALAERTDLLPLITPDLSAENPPVIGKSTEAAIQSGLYWGTVGAVRELVARITQELQAAPQLFVTGGDAQRLARHMAADARFVPDLVLIGIVSSSKAWQPANGR